MVKLKNYCHEKGCKNFEIIDWQGGFMKKYWCKKHRKKKRNK